MDALEFEPEISNADREKAMEAREGFYQTQLKTLERYGGMNTLDSNHILFKSTGALFFSLFILLDVILA